MRALSGLSILALFALLSPLAQAQEPAPAPPPTRETTAPMEDPEDPEIAALRKRIEANEARLAEEQRKLRELAEVELFDEPLSDSIDPSGDLNDDDWVGKPLIRPGERARKATLDWLIARRARLARSLIGRSERGALKPLDELDEQIADLREELEQVASLRLIGPQGTSFARFEYRNNRDLQNRFEDRDERLPLRLDLGFVALAPGLARAVVVGTLSETFFADDRQDDFSDGPDLYESYLDILLFRAPDYEFVPRIGRQALLFGSERVLGANRFLVFHRSFDALRLSYRDAATDVSIFAGRPVRRRAIDDEKFNDSDPNESLIGLYASWLPSSETQADLYLLRRQSDVRQRGERSLNLDTSDVWTLGMRYLTRAESGLGLEVELMGQLGRVAGDSHQSFMAAATLSYERCYAPIGEDADSAGLDASPQVRESSKKVPWMRLKLGADWAQGDNDPTDGRSEGFQAVYPSSHEFFGRADLLGFRNTIDLYAGALFQFRTRPTRTGYALFALEVTGHIYRQENRNDSAYDINEQRLYPTGRGSQSQDLGREIDIELHLFELVTIGYARFEPGTALRRRGLNDAADFFYFNFGF